MLRPLSPTSSNDLARQLHLVGTFGAYLSNHPDSFSAESAETLNEILFVLESYGAELSRLLDDKPRELRRVLQSKTAIKTAVDLIDRMLSNEPGLLAYSPNTAPKTMSEVVLNFLTHAVISLNYYATSTATV
jgi:hypothetical protein